MRIVHLPCYNNNPYQALLMQAQRELGHSVWEGGGGGDFIGVALSEWNADLIHFHWLHPYLIREHLFLTLLRATRFLLEVALLRHSGVKVVWTIHNLQNHDNRHTWVERWYSLIFAKFCSRCFVHSFAAGELARKRFKLPSDKISKIPHGNYIDVYANSVCQRAARLFLAVKASAKVFLFLGRIEPYKGILDLIDAFSECRGEDRILIIAGKAGDPCFLAKVKELSSMDSRIMLFPNRIADNDLQYYYNAADVVVFPFKEILTSGSLVLAMSFGKPVIVPRLPSLEEIIPEGGVTWFSSEPGEQLKDALERCNDSLGKGGALNFKCARAWSWNEIAILTLSAVGTNSVC